MSTRYERGMQVRRSVLGDSHVDRATENIDELDADFQTMITEGAWGTVWASEGLPDRERSMLTLALLAALGNLEEFSLHMRAGERTGVSNRDVAELLQHVAVYAGVPRANQAMKLAKAILQERNPDPGTSTDSTSREQGR